MEKQPLCFQSVAITFQPHATDPDANWIPEKQRADMYIVRLYTPLSPENPKYSQTAAGMFAYFHDPRLAPAV